MKIEMRENKHLWVTTNPAKGDLREIIIDQDKDVRVCDGQHMVKIRFRGTRIRDVLVDDIFVWQP